MAYGSLNNLIAGSNPTITPEVGMGATHIGWTDREPYTVVEVVNADTIVVQEDNAKRVDTNGMSESQSYEYTPNPDGRKVTVTRRKNGQWIAKGEPMKTGTKFVVGSRSKYHDYSF